MDLFTAEKQSVPSGPLSARMRPRTLSEYVGQGHILGEGKLLRRAIEADRIQSLIFYGPPGCGKTGLAHLISTLTAAHYERLNAVSSNVQEIRAILDRAKKRTLVDGKKTILFIDEIHRFNKAQQDVLMPDVEVGNPILIGTTTHNPFFSVNAPLLSRSQIFEFKPLTEEDLVFILKNAARDKERGLGAMNMIVDDEALKHLARISDGDARRALNALEIGARTTRPGADGVIHYTLKTAEESIQKKAVVYDGDEDGHYNTISAFIKSMRGTDPDAALYWLAKMLVAGEDPRFIARRIVIAAAEDVGNADPQALVIANTAFQVSEFLGMPEARIPLAQAAVYVACAPKSNAAYLGIDKAMKDVENERTEEVPDHLKSTSYRGAKQLGHGKDYKYAHDYDDHYVEQEYMPHKARYYFPGNLGYEAKIKDWLWRLKKSSPEKGA